MHDKRLDQAQQLAVDLLDVVHGGGSVDKLIEQFPKAEPALKELSASKETIFSPMVMVFDVHNDLEKIFVSSIVDKSEFLIDALTVLSVMDAPSVVLCLDAYIKLNVEDVDTGGLSLEQMHALGEAFTCLSFLSWNLTEGLYARYVPYETSESGLILLEDKVTETDNDGFKSMDQSFQALFNGINSLLAQPISDRIREFWIEFISNTEQSTAFFTDGDSPEIREEALDAFKYLMNIEDGRRYAQCIIEDSLLDASRLGILQRPQHVYDTLKEIEAHVNTETEIGKCLTKARLT